MLGTAVSDWTFVHLSEPKQISADVSIPSEITKVFSSNEFPVVLRINKRSVIWIVSRVVIRKYEYQLAGAAGIVLINEDCSLRTEIGAVCRFDIRNQSINQVRPALA